MFQVFINCVNLNSNQLKKGYCSLDLAATLFVESEAEKKGFKGKNDQFIWCLLVVHAGVNLCEYLTLGDCANDMIVRNG